MLYLVEINMKCLFFVVFVLNECWGYNDNFKSTENDQYGFKISDDYGHKDYKNDALKTVFIDQYLSAADPRFNNDVGDKLGTANKSLKSGDDDKGLSKPLIVNQELREEKIRPCVLEDLDCIRNFLAANSDCKVQNSPSPDPLLVPIDKLFIPFVNLTITHVNLHVEGFKSAKITEFYVNKYTGNLVIAINVQRLIENAPKSFFTYQRTAKEAIVLSDFTSVTYDSATFTAILPKVPHLKLELAEIHADIHDGTPVFMIGPRAYNSTDPDVVTAYADFIANIPSIVREAFLFQSYLLTAVYIQRTLCDFGVPVYKSYLRHLNTKAFTNVLGLGYSDNVYQNVKKVDYDHN